MFFFFRLDTKEKEPKRKNQGCVFPATPVLPPAKGQKLATLKQSALLNAEGNTGVAGKTRPGTPCGVAAFGIRKIALF